MSNTRNFYADAVPSAEAKAPKTKPGAPGMDAVIGEWKDVQTRTFTRWANRVLVAENEEVNNLFEDMKSGIVLVKLVSLCSRKPMPKKYNKAAKLRIQRLENLNLALQELKDDKVAMVNIGAEDIESGTQKIVLALMWALILRYQIRRALIDPRAKAAQQAAQENAENQHYKTVRFQDEEEEKGEASTAVLEVSAGDDALVEAQIPQDIRAIKELLLAWVSGQIVKFGLPAVHNFTTDWQDGKALCALTESVEPGSCKMDALPENPTERVALAIDTAAKLGIQKLLDPEEITTRTDQHSMMVYISYFRDYFNDRLGEALAEASTADERAEADRAAAAMEEATRHALALSAALEAKEAEDAERVRQEEEAAKAEAERLRLAAEEEAKRLAIERAAELERQRLENEDRERVLQAEREAAIAAAAAAELAAAQASLEEKIERERIAAAAQAEVERLEREDKERKAKEEQLRLEREKEEQEKQELERQWRAKIEEERLAREREEQEQERLEREEAERLARERLEREAAEEAKIKEEAEALILAQQKEAERIEQERIAAEKHAEAARLFIAQTMRGKKEGGPIGPSDGKSGEVAKAALPQIESVNGVMCLAADGIPIISPNGRVDLGLLRMCVWFDNVKNLLMIGLSSGLCLPAMDSNGFSDPFLKLRLVPERKTKRWKSKVLKKTLNPVFMQIHSFPLLPTLLDDTRLIVDCFDYDFAATDDFIGLVDIPLTGVPQLNPASLKQFDAQKLETWVDSSLYAVVRWYALQPEDAGFKRPSGSIPFENDCWKYADGSSKMPSGIFQLGDGNITSAFRYNGKLVFRKLEAGARYLEDSTVQLANGTIVLPSGAIVRLDGNLRMPDGSIKPPVWPIPHHPTPAGFVQLPDFSFTGPHDGKRLPVVEPPASNLGLRFGCIKLSARYYSSQSKILIKVERCAGLPAMDRNGFSDPYVVVQMIDTAMGPSVGKTNSITREREAELAAGQTRSDDLRAQVVLAERRTTVIKKTLNPRWDSEFGFAVKRRQLSHRELLIEVWDWDMGASDDFIGGVTLKCSQLGVDIKEADCIRWYALQPRDEEAAKTRVYLELPPAQEREKPLPSII